MLLIGAFLAVRRQRYRAHGTLMIGAFLVSCVFLVSYVYSKVAFGEVTTESLGLGWGFLKVSYLVVLIPHVILAMVMLPFIGMAFWGASRRQWARHTRWSVPGYWMWLYVSITGVLVYVMLYHLIPAALAGEAA